MIRTLAVIGVATIASSFSFAPAHAQGQGRDNTDFTWSKRLASGASLTIRSADGRIDVRESSSDRVEVRAVKRVHSRGNIRDVSFDVRESGDDVMICSVYNGTSLCDRRNNTRNIRVAVDYTVLIPRTLKLNATTGNGDVVVDKAGAEVAVTTGNGRVTVGETTGRVDATTGNGDVQVESARGPVHVTTGNGRVFVATSNGPVDVQSGNGDIDVRMKTLTSDAGMNFQTGSGNIHVTLPADFNGELDMTTGSGNLRSEFEIQLVGRINPQHLRGRIGKGGATVRFMTGSGSVEIRKAP